MRRYPPAPGPTGRNMNKVGFKEPTCYPQQDMGADMVGDKISVLMHEGVPQKQAVAEALSMKRAGRLRKGGVYVHVKK